MHVSRVEQHSNEEEMRVYFLSHSSAKEGAERALLELIDALQDRDVEVHVLVPSPGPLTKELKDRGIAFSVLPYSRWMGKSFPIWKRIARIILTLALILPVAITIKRWKCDAIYTNTATVCVGAIAAKLLGRPHVWHLHELGFEQHQLTFDFGEKISLWLMDRCSSVCIASSDAVAQKYGQYIEPRKIKVVYGSVSTAQCGSAVEAVVPANTGIRCVIVGALRQAKGQEDGIRAIAELMRDGIDVELWIVGTGDSKYSKYLHDLVEENALTEHVKFFGYVDNALPLISSADALLMCSRHEAFGRVTVEAMKLGKPVIGARSGGTTELIFEGFNGLLYTPRNHRELADKIKYLYEEPVAAKRMGKSGQKWATEQFNQNRHGEEILQVLQETIR